MESLASWLIAVALGLLVMELIERALRRRAQFLDAIKGVYALIVVAAVLLAVILADLTQKAFRVARAWWRENILPPGVARGVFLQNVSNQIGPLEFALEVEVLLSRWIFWALFYGPPRWLRAELRKVKEYYLAFVNLPEADDRFWQVVCKPVPLEDEEWKPV